MENKKMVRYQSEMANEEIKLYSPGQTQEHLIISMK